jgi:hypothetical protein
LAKYVTKKTPGRGDSGNGGYSENFRSWDLDADIDCGEEFEIGL